METHVQEHWQYIKKGAFILIRPRQQKNMISVHFNDSGVKPFNNNVDELDEISDFNMLFSSFKV